MRRDKKAAGGSAALRAALGIGRLDSVAAGRSRVRESIAALRKLDTTAQRQLAKVLLMVAAGALGFWGYMDLPLDPDKKEVAKWAMSRVWSNMFRTLQLLTMQFPPNLPTEMPWQLQVGRFALPIFAAWFTFTAVVRRFNRPLMVWYTALARNHVVLIGDSPVARAFAGAFRRGGRGVIAIVKPGDASDGPEPIEQAGASVVFGDPTRPKILRRAGIHRAGIVIAADDVGNSALPLSTAVAGVIREGRSASAPPLTFLLRLGQPELRALVATQIAAAMRESHVDLRLYVRERTVARALLARYPADWGQAPGPHDVHAAILGLGGMGRELMLQLARIAVPTPGRRAIITAIDTLADGLKDQILGENPGLANCAALRFIQSKVHPSAIRAEEVATWFLEPMPATAIYVCCGDDTENLSMAIGIRRAYARLGRTAPPLFVYQRDNPELVEALPHIHATAIDTLRILPFGDITEEADPFYLIDEEVDDLARLMHEQYLKSRGDIAKTEGTTPATMPWATLSDAYKAANRSQADHILSKLRRLGLHATSDKAAIAPPIPPGLLEELAEQEHERWSRDRWLAGWTHADKRDDSRRHHPNLVPYAKLNEALKDLDRQTVTTLPALLRDLGIGLRRDLRLGIWFEDNDVPPALLALLTERATPPSRDRHVQLVLPLRHQAELTLAQTLSRRGHTGVDVALARTADSSAGDIGRSLDRLGVSRLIEASDRAFMLIVPEGPDSRSATLRALCDVCDQVLIASASADTARGVADRLDAAHRPKIVPVIASA